ncbi:MAG: YlxR family protein [Kineosporiaceae bacterium]
MEVDGVWSVVPDPDRRRAGRGASLHPDPRCLDLAERRRAFPRALRRSGPLQSTSVAEHVADVHRPPVTVLTGSGSDADEHPMSTQP